MDLDIILSMSIILQVKTVKPKEGSFCFPEWKSYLETMS